MSVAKLQSEQNTRPTAAGDLQGHGSSLFAGSKPCIFFYLIEGPFDFPVSHLTVTWDNALKQAAEQITECKLFEKLVQVDNGKCRQNQFHVRRY